MTAVIAQRDDAAISRWLIDIEIAKQTRLSNHYCRRCHRRPYLFYVPRGLPR